MEAASLIHLHLQLATILRILSKWIFCGNMDSYTFTYVTLTQTIEVELRLAFLIQHTSITSHPTEEQNPHYNFKHELEYH
jgi:hypothetical protein